MLFLRLLFLIIFLSGCNTIEPLGKVGPQKLGVYSISKNDFLSSSRMLLVLNKKGDVVAFTGGTVAGAGTIGLQTGSTLATAGAVLYGAKALEHGLRNAAVNVKVPNHFDANLRADFNANVNGTFTHNHD